MNKKYFIGSFAICTLGLVSFGLTADAATNEMHRLYNPNSGEHFYTADDGEKNGLVKLGWSYEGVGWVAPDTGEAVYRLYNPNAGDHHYTLDTAEKDNLVRVGWNYEGIGWYSSATKEVPLYRAYNKNAIAGSHNYTKSRAEQNNLISLGWQDEGIGWYGVGDSQGGGGSTETTTSSTSTTSSSTSTTSSSTSSSSSSTSSSTTDSSSSSGGGETPKPNPTPAPASGLSISIAKDNFSDGLVREIGKQKNAVDVNGAVDTEKVDALKISGSLDADFFKGIRFLRSLGSLDLSGCTNLADVLDSLDVTELSSLKEIKLPAAFTGSIKGWETKGDGEAAEGSVAITNKNFPDVILRNYLKKLIGYDAETNTIPIANVTTIKFDAPESQKNIEKIYNLEGIGIFTNLESVSITNQKIKSIKTLENVSNIKTLDVSGNYLTELDLSNFSHLESVHCQDNFISANGLTLPTEKNVLQKIVCSLNNIENLDVTAYSNLTYLDCWGYRLKSLKVAGLSKLEVLDCSSGNQVTLGTLDLSGLPALKKLNCSGIGLTSLDLSGAPNLEELNCASNPLTKIDVLMLKNLRDLNVSSTILESLDVKGLNSLEKLYCFQTYSHEQDNFKSIDLDNENLQLLDIFEHAGVTELDLSKVPNLTTLDIGVTGIKNIDVSMLTNLKNFYCIETPLEKLDLSNSKDLQSFRRSSVPDAAIVEAMDSLEKMGISTTVTELYCGGETIKEVDLDKYSNLETLSCAGIPEFQLKATTDAVNLKSLSLVGIGITEETKANIAMDKLINLEQLAFGGAGDTFNLVTKKLENLTELYVTESQTERVNLDYIPNVKIFEYYNGTPWNYTIQELSSLTQLEKFDYRNGTETDLSALSKLKEFSYYGENSTELKLPQSLEKLDYYPVASSKATKIDLSGLNNLTSCSIYGPQLQSIIIGQNDKLSFLSVTKGKNKLTIDASKAENLHSVYINPGENDAQEVVVYGLDERCMLEKDRWTVN